MATPSELVNRLHDIHGAPPAAWWPPAPGWWVLAAAVLSIAAVVLWRRRRRGWHLSALRELQSVEREFAETQDAARCVARISVLLRSVAVTRSPNLAVAGLTGDAWLRYLDEPLAARDFSSGVGRVLVTAPYMQAADIDVAALCELTRKWLRSAT